MGSYRTTRRSIQHILEDFENDETLDEYDNVNFDIAFIPDENNDDLVDSSDNDSDCTNAENTKEGYYEFFYRKYDESQKLLESNHTYKWVNGDYQYDRMYNKEKIFLTEECKLTVRNSSFVDLFELFFSDNLKEYIISATL